jgi:hypothetical protein
MLGLISARVPRSTDVPNSSEPIPAGATNPSTTLEYADRVAHLKTGYDNSQAVVRFLDTKATAAIGAIPLVIAALTGLFGLVKDWARWERAFQSPHVCLLWMLVTFCLVAAIFGIVFAVRTVWFAFEAISPRDTGSSNPSVLFPYDVKGFDTRVAYFKQDTALKAEVYEDYEQQINQMGRITKAKLSGVQKAIGQLRYFFIASLILLILFIATAGLATLLVAILPVTTP